MKTFTHDGLAIAYRDAGAGPAIVMLHNGGTSSSIWRHQVDALADRHRVVAVDLPGFGASSRQGPNVASAETIEQTQMNGEACYKVKIVWKSGRETFDCYSVASGFLVASVGKQETPMGTIEITNLVSDYKDFGGQKIATRLTQQAMGAEQVLLIQNVEYDAAPDSLFEMPAAIKALVEKKP